MAPEHSGPIPDKVYFKISEVCDIVGVKQYVLRYWESEFDIVRPQRAASQQRLYRRVDVENLLRIKKLLKEEGFTISGARKVLAQEMAARRAGEREGMDGDRLAMVRRELEAIRNILREEE